MNEAGSPDERVLQRMKKMLALARRGVGGERENAQRMLEKLLAKHGMTLADMVDEQVQRVEVCFSYKTAEEKALLIQLAGMVFDTHKPQAWAYRGKKALFFKCTPAERAELQIHFDAYRRQLALELRKVKKTALTAFFIANDVYPKSESDAGDSPQMDAGELKELIAAAMAMGMRRTPVHKAITN